MLENIIIAGAGGQGVMLLGKVIAGSVMHQGSYVSWFPCYGAEVRGGSAYCMVVISDKEISSVYVTKADTLIMLNEPSLRKFSARLKPGGCIWLNSSLVKGRVALGKKVFRHPFSDIAVRLGDIRVANMVALGAYLAAQQCISLSAVKKTIREMAPSKPLARLNLAALAEGLRL
jgi:2-oxoglutarate ferredoxin oxidoreductase subunit gamma